MKEVYEEFKENICSKPLLKMEPDIKIFEDKNNQINQHFAHQKIET